jgi:uncharacterized protein YeaO (DUF488 family)
MSNILSAIQDDIDEYEALCRRFKEPIQTKYDSYGNNLPDCYGAHALALKTRLREESTPKATKEAKVTEEAASAPTAEGAEEKTSEAYAKFKFKLTEEHAAKLKGAFPDMDSTTFIQVALTILNWIHDEEANGRVILSATPEGNDVTRLVPLVEIAKQK